MLLVHHQLPWTSQTGATFFGDLRSMRDKDHQLTPVFGQMCGALDDFCDTAKDLFQAISGIFILGPLKYHREFSRYELFEEKSGPGFWVSQV